MGKVVAVVRIVSIVSGSSDDVGKLRFTNLAWSLSRFFDIRGLRLDDMIAERQTQFLT